MMRRLVAALFPLVVAWGVMAAGLGIVVLHLHLHQNWLLTLAGTATLALGVSRFSSWFNPGQGRLRWARVAITTALVLVATARFEHAPGHPAAWAMWIPIQGLAFLPWIVLGAPWVLLACALPFGAVYWLVVVRHRSGPFAVALAGPAVWAAIAVPGFYRNTFTDTSSAALEHQVGVKLLAANPSPSCGFFASECDARNFPRQLAVDPSTGLLWASYGSTASDLHRPQAKLYAVDPAGQWLEVPETRNANQLRDFHIDPARRWVATAQWGGPGLQVHDLDSRALVRTIPYPAFEGESQPASAYVDGDDVVVAHIWPPLLWRHRLSDGALINSADLYQLGWVGSGVQVERGVISRKRRRLWMPLGRFRETVIEIDLDSLRPTRCLDFGLGMPWALALDDDAGKLYASIWSRVDAIDLATGTLSASFPTDFGVREAYFDSRRQSLFLTNYLTGEVIEHAAETGALTRRIRVGPKPLGIAVSGDHLYVSSVAGIAKIDLGRPRPR